MSFCARMEQEAESKRFNIVLALDFPFEKPEKRQNLFSRTKRVLNEVHPYVCAVKFNRHLILSLGVCEKVPKLVAEAHEVGLLAIMDCKINDIGSSNQTIAEYYYSVGFDALTANPFVGWEEGLKPVFTVARKLQRGVILLVYMSHKGAAEGYGQITYDAEIREKTPQYISFAKKALDWNADGAIVGATFPEIVRKAHEILGNKIPIYSPGIGFQGGAIELSMKAGSTYLIVGRTITLPQDPPERARKIRDLANSLS